MKTSFALFRIQAAAALAIAMAGAPALAQSWQATCEYVGAPTREPVGDQENHALGAVQYTCRVLDGPLANAVLTGSNLFEWNGPNATALYAEGVYRKSGTLAVFRVTDLHATLQMAGGKPVGNTTDGTGMFHFGSGEAASFARRAFKFSSRGTASNQFLMDMSLE